MTIAGFLPVRCAGQDGGQTNRFQRAVLTLCDTRQRLPFEFAQSGAALTGVGRPETFQRMNTIPQFGPGRTGVGVLRCVWREAAGIIHG